MLHLYTSVHISTVLVGNGRNIGLDKVCLRQLNEKMRAMAQFSRYTVYTDIQILTMVFTLTATHMTGLLFLDVLGICRMVFTQLWLNISTSLSSG